LENESKKKSLRERLRVKYRVSVLDELTLSERWHFRLNGWGAIVWIAMLFLLALALFSLLILYTPIRNYLPGYSENIRQQLIVESSRLDSMGTSLELQRQYLNIIKQVVAGEVESDTVQSLDSMQIIMREQLLEAKSEATAEFIAQYEAKEKDYLQLFDVANTTPVLSFFRPARGVVLQSFSAKEHRYGVTIQTAKHDNVTAILAGAVVYTNYELDNTYTIMLQHDNYLSIYRGVSKLLKRVGETVQAGESIALLEDKPLNFQLWQNGQPINPEEVIAF
jgi:murein DD-endopeptidase MepM/ murein hydrolase activator NlpD